MKQDREQLAFQAELLAWLFPSDWCVAQRREVPGSAEWCQVRQFWADVARVEALQAERRDDQ